MLSSRLPAARARLRITALALVTGSVLVAAQPASALTPPTHDAERTMALTLTAGVRREIIPHQQSLSMLPGGDIQGALLGPGDFALGTDLHADATLGWTTDALARLTFATNDLEEDHRISPRVSLATAATSTFAARLQVGVDVGLFTRDPYTLQFVPDRRLNTFVGIDRGITVPLCGIPAPGSPPVHCSAAGVTLLDQPVTLRYGVLALHFHVTLVGSLGIDVTDQGVTTVRTFTIGTRIESKTLAWGGTAPAYATDTISTRCGSGDQHLGYSLSGVRDRVAVGAGIDADVRLQAIVLSGEITVLGVRIHIDVPLPDITLGRISSGRVPLGTVSLAGPTSPLVTDLGVIPAVERCAA